jgi:hypothetical protein
VSYARFIGLDISLSGTGYCGLLPDGSVAFSGVCKSWSDLLYLNRYDNISNELIHAINPQEDDFFLIENYAFNARGRITGLAELTGIIKFLLYENFEISPLNIWACSNSTLKKYALGKREHGSKVTKSQMLKAVYKRWNFDTENDNIADAYVLARIAWMMHTLSSDKRTTIDKEVIKSVNKTNEGIFNGKKNKVQTKRVKSSSTTKKGKGTKVQKNKGKTFKRTR